MSPFFICFPQIPLSLLRGMLSLEEENHYYNCSRFQCTPSLVYPGEESILLQDLCFSPFSSCTSKTVKSSFALSFLPMSQHLVGYSRLGFSSILSLQLFDTELCHACSFVQRGRVPSVTAPFLSALYTLKGDIPILRRNALKYPIITASI